MSDTHAHTAKVQADVQTGNTHFPPGHVEAERPIETLGGGQTRPLAPYLTGAALVVIAVIAIVVLLA